jgi:hypothetical protein
MIELLLILLVLALLILVLWPSVRQARGRQVCVNQLRQIAVAGFMSNNGYGLSTRWGTNKNGTKEYIETGEVFRHFLAMTNELKTPKILVCPTDKQRTRATHWTNFSNQKLSYFLAVDVVDFSPQMLLAGDRNITGGLLTNRNLMLLWSNSSAAWSSQLHKKFGNIALADGSVHRMTEQQLRLQIQADIATETWPPRTHKSVVRLAIP